MNKLARRSWNNLGIKYLDKNSCIREYLEPANISNSEISTGILNLDINSMENSITKVGRPISNILIDSDVEFVNDEYDTEFGKMDGTNEIWLYRSTKDLTNLVTGCITKDLISYGSNIYTDTINLMDIVSHSSGPSVSSRVDITVQYTKRDRRASVEISNPKIYTRDITFEGFDYTDKLVITNFVEDIDMDVTVEYINGTVRVIPKTDNVIECIIRKCTVTYGNIK